ncbi:hypothetical protein DUNSADRAFT_16670 [Dunaliella salina]|uniref:Uncharacterized protein n=1 Tax=Dunaliella salina TaxID=3046 RepID=A0ABQ7H0R7_DUNSA|nr:hypothetical protein DUNSADRAFT_16670 [Dunaliella salina]|eukprot:KAF5840436.1 hypothetical protein DUNSADRAFT_16670 [Dunaliella salina]
MVSVIDGESWNEAQPANTSRIRELLKSDEGLPLLSCSMPGHRVHPSGRIILKLQVRKKDGIHGCFWQTCA